MPNQISGEQFSFLEVRSIHENVGVAQEELHSIKVEKLKAMVVKMEISKAYDSQLALPVINDNTFGMLCTDCYICDELCHLCIFLHLL